ncbi:unnamed protein product [marine sediment metagenome]|uniref:N-acetyltransferase n=1 Tax=marine sediment metagenome TaxID=412755 RepID=X0SC15_9ZZZZ
MKDKKDFFAAPTAIIKDCKIGKGTKIWNYVNMYGCKIGENCNIGSYTEIQQDSEIGNNVTISSHSFICSLVKIEDDVFISHGVMTINDINPPSMKRTGTKDEWKPTLIKKGAIIGSNVTLFPVTIGEGAIVGAGSVVTKDVEPYTTIIGNPARRIKITKEEEK